MLINPYGIGRGPGYQQPPQTSHGMYNQNNLTINQRLLGSCTTTVLPFKDFKSGFTPLAQRGVCTSPVGPGKNLCGT